MSKSTPVVMYMCSTYKAMGFGKQPINIQDLSALYMAE